MKTKIFVLLFLLCAIRFFSFGIEKKPTGCKVQWFGVIEYSYNQIPITIGNDKFENKSVYPYFAMEFGADFNRYLTIGIITGMDRHHFNEPIDFVNLPLSMQMDSTKLNSFVLGLRAKSEFIRRGKFSLSACSEFLYFKTSSVSKVVTLPIARGTTTIENSFYHGSIDLTAKYLLLPRLTIFVGPQLNVINGKLKISESIEKIAGNEILSYKQKNIMGLVTGLNWIVGPHFKIDVKLGLLAKTTFTTGISYIF